MFLNELCIYSYNAESFRQLNSHFINVSYSYCILFCEKHIPKDVPVKMAVRNLYDSDKRCKLESSFFPPFLFMWCSPSCIVLTAHHSSTFREPWIIIYIYGSRHRFIFVWNLFATVCPTALQIHIDRQPAEYHKEPHIPSLLRFCLRNKFLLSLTSDLVIPCSANKLFHQKKENLTVTHQLQWLLTTTMLLSSGPGLKQNFGHDCGVFVN